MSLMQSQNVVVRRSNGGFMGAKRQHLPFVIEWDCPRCGKRAKEDLLDVYVSYPDIPGAREHTLYCRDCDCGTGPFTMRIDVTMTLEDRNADRHQG